MVFLIFFLIIIALIFGVDYFFFDDKNVQIPPRQEIHHEKRIDKTQTPYLNEIFKNNDAQK